MTRPLQGEGDGRSQPRAAKQEPPKRYEVLAKVTPRPPIEPLRPDLGNIIRPVQRAKKEEPPRRSVANLNPSPNGPVNPKAKKEEPPFELSRGVMLRTAAGAITFEDVLRKTDGAALRDLLFRQRGLVDINGCKLGKLSHGTLEWGGSLFTIAFLLLQAEDRQQLGAPPGGTLTWERFFPVWMQMTERVTRGTTRGQVSQSPEAFKLGGP